MKEEMIKKIEKLYMEGKISEEVKEKLLKEIEGIEEEKYEEKFKGSFKDVELNFIFEDLEIEGSENVSDITFERGKEGVTVEENKDRLVIKSKSKGIHIDIFGFKIGEDIYTENVKIIVPSNINLFINNISGDIDVKNINGNVKLKTISGDIKLEDIKGDVDCYTLSGDIRINNISGEFNIVSKTGDINIDNIEKEGVIKTYSGDLEIKDGNFEKILLSTFSGDQRVDNVNINDSMEIKTMSGDIDIDLLTKDIRILIETKSGEGKINYEGKITNIDRGEISFGDGSKKLFVKTISGDINIDID